VSVTGRTLSESASKALLGEHGVPIADAREVRTAAEAADIGFPVVVKLCGDSIAHKTERGLVKLRLGDADAVEARPPSCSARRHPQTAMSRCSSRRWCPGR